MKDTRKLELYKTVRPLTFNHVLGQDAAVATLKGFCRNANIPRAMLLAGPSGTGKTTCARILARRCKASSVDTDEINCAILEKPISAIRRIQERVGMSPMNGDSRAYILDEVQSLSRARFTQEALLKVLEEQPKHAYFFLCSTDPAKIIKAIRNRCTLVTFKPLPDAAVRQLLLHTVAHQNYNVPVPVVDKIVEVCEGSARRALVELEKVAGVDGEAGQIAAVSDSDASEQGITLARALVNPRSSWSDVAKVLKALDGDAEAVRRQVLGYASSVVLGGGKLAPLAAAILDSFFEPLYDIGKPGLVLACWNFSQSRRGSGR